MRALILKDILVLRRYARMLALIAVAFFIPMLMGAGEYSMLPMVMMLCAMLPVTSMSYDELAKWDGYAATLPVTRAQVVGAKYLLGIAMTAAGALISLALSALAAWIGHGAIPQPGELLAGVGVLALISLVVVAILMPLIYRFGPEKARILLIVVIGVGVGGVTALLSNGSLALPGGGWTALIWAASVAVAAIVYGSFRLSAAIFERKAL